MTAKKNPEDRKPRGGARTGAGRKGKLVPTETRMEWDKQLTRAVSKASENMGVIKHDHFWTLREVQTRWGKEAAAEFKTWFEATRHIDTDTADKLLLEFERGLISEEKFKRLLFSTAFKWVWSLKSERQRDAWELARGIRTLH